jgi:hypothetical protein
MELLYPEELWRRIPPEEKLEVLARCHAAGVRAAIAMIGVVATIAVGLKMTILFWLSLFAAPLVFQFCSSKTWKHERSKTILEYLAARSAARRFAFSANSQDLMVQMVFKGTVYEHRKGIPDALQYERITDRLIEHPVWIALLPDAFVMLAEGNDGADNIVSHLLNEKVTLTARSPSGGSEYTADRELQISIKDKKDEESIVYTLRSHQPAALVVFEKRALRIHEEYLYKKAKATGQIEEEGGLLEAENFS